MNRRQFASGLVLLLSLPALLVAQDKAAPPKQNLPTQRILIHVHTNNPEDWKKVVAKADELVSAGQPYSTYVEILATGDGLKLVDKDSSMKADVANSLEKDVTFAACHASMKENHMSIDQLNAGVGTVPSGGREMKLRKRDGWTVLDQDEVK